MNKPIVTVACTTYNHEKYIEQTIRGFLIQKTTFPIEIIIHDDASIDSTPNIITKYAEKYPKLIIPIFQEENQYSKGNKPWSNFVFPEAKGKYIAICEGDDYWTDPLKLQRQVDFLEANESFSLVCTNVEIVNNHDIVQRKRFQFKNNFEINLNYLLKNNHITTCSALFVTERLNLKEWPKINFLDKYVWISLLQNGSCLYMNNITARYRMHDSGIYSGLKEYSKSIKRIEDYKFYRKVFPEYANIFSKKILKNLIFGLVSSIKRGKFKSFIHLLKIYFR